jgi:hypothetical protein
MWARYSIACTYYVVQHRELQKLQVGKTTHNAYRCVENLESLENGPMGGGYYVVRTVNDNAMIDDTAAPVGP